ncbi:MAG: Bcr/CflA family efflux MFS transporter [Rhodocyclaceae bacterium]|nr:MAG: Bcr/CflA family efflux MFS transporter [Rhodocyclaceae bacterium]
MPISAGLLPFLLAALAAIGPLSVDTYLPAFPAIAEALHATPLQVQQSMTAYLITFCPLMLWHGAIADAVGRRRVILAGLALYAAASLFCVFATRIEMLWLGRALQGLAGGVGGVVGRAIIRDRFQGAAAVRQMAHVSIIFAAAPAVAPVIGGWLLVGFQWHAIFVFLTLYTLLLLLACVLWLPETLTIEHRHSLHPRALWQGYREVLGNPAFLKISIATAFFMNGQMLYIMSSPIFLMRHLGLSPQSFYWLFVPVIMGMVTGNVLSSRLAGKLRVDRVVALGIVIVLAAATGNVVLNAFMVARLPWAVVPMMIYAVGLFTAFSGLQLMALDMFPARRGMASSCQSFIVTLGMGLTAGVAAPLLWDSTLHLAGGMAIYCCLGLAFYRWARAALKQAEQHLP